jgi:nucleoprotein TPR
LSKTRESLVAAETSQGHLQQRGDDLSRQLEASLEKLSVYERRPGASINGAISSLEGRSREELLEAEVAELKYVFIFDA